MRAGARLTGAGARANLGAVSDAAAEPAILIKPGPLLVQAATWLGHACWAEVRLQEVLTHWLALEPEGEHIEILWHERADAAERAEAWYRRLPELREYPRAQFIVPSSVAVAELFDRLQALDAPARSLDRRGALAAVLRGLRLGYKRQQDISVGPADAPAALTIATALRSTFGTGGADPSPAWTHAVAEAGGLP